MNESAKYEVYKKKLQGVCDENNLIFSLNFATYPCSMVVEPLPDEGQDSLFSDDTATDTGNDPDARIVFTFVDGDLVYNPSGRFVIGNALLNKLTNLFKKLHYCYVQYFHREIIGKNPSAAKLVPDTAIPEPSAEALDGVEDDDADLSR